jgi:hypothetical protein
MTRSMAFHPAAARGAVGTALGVAATVRAPPSNRGWQDRLPDLTGRDVEARHSPVRLGLFSLITLWADSLVRSAALRANAAA